jgi:hypothetical protein
MVVATLATCSRHVSRGREEELEHPQKKTSTYATIAAPSTPPPVEPMQDTAEGASHTDEVSHTAHMILEMDEPDQGNSQRPFETASPKQ